MEILSDNHFHENEFYYDSLIRRSLSQKPSDVYKHLHSWINSPMKGLTMKMGFNAKTQYS